VNNKESECVSCKNTLYDDFFIKLSSFRKILPHLKLDRESLISIIIAISFEKEEYILECTRTKTEVIFTYNNKLIKIKELKNIHMHCLIGDLKLNKTFYGRS